MISIKLTNTFEQFEQGMLTIKLKNLPGHGKRLN